MIIRKSHLILFTAIAAAAFVSCKDDDDTESLPYLNGVLTIKCDDLQDYIKLDGNNKYTMIPEGVTHPENRGIGYKWKVTPSGMDEYETVKDENAEGNGAFTFSFNENKINQDTIGTFTITCQAYADGYTSSSATKYVTVVRKAQKEKDGVVSSIEKAGYDFDGSATGTDADGNKYLLVTGADGNTWMQQNLALTKEGDNTLGVAYRNADAMSDIFGRYYTWREAMGLGKGETLPEGSTYIQGICPEGYHIPTDAEWTGLANAVLGGEYGNAETPWENLQEKAVWKRDGVKISREFMAGETISGGGDYGIEAGSATFNGTEMWKYYPEVGDPTNRSMISALPAGYATRSNGEWTFKGVNTHAIFWTADQPEGDVSRAFCRIIIDSAPEVSIEAYDIDNFAASVRCVKNK